MIKNPTYKFYEYARFHDDGTISIRTTAVSSFAGKSVRGYADCHSKDEYDTTYGRTLAAARCNEKIAKKRHKRACNKVDEAKAQVQAAMAHLEKMMQYEADAAANYNTASYELATILAEKQCHCNGECGENCECDCDCHK